MAGPKHKVREGEDAGGVCVEARAGGAVVVCLPQSLSCRWCPAASPQLSERAGREEEGER